MICGRFRFQPIYGVDIVEFSNSDILMWKNNLESRNFLLRDSGYFNYRLATSSKIICLTQANSYVTAATLIRSQIPISLESLDTRLMLTSSNNYNAFCPLSIVVWLFFGPTFSILGTISRNRRENFLASST